MSPTFLRTRSQVSATADVGVESFIVKNTSDSPGFE
jgi:hypothetical protein